MLAWSEGQDGAHKDKQDQAHNEGHLDPARHLGRATRGGHLCFVHAYGIHGAMDKGCETRFHPASGRRHVGWPEPYGLGKGGRLEGEDQEQAGP